MVCRRRFKGVLTWLRVVGWLGPIPSPVWRFAEPGSPFPTAFAMAVGGMFPNTPHGMALASVYRACLEFTWESAVPAFARLARILEPTLEDVDTSEAAAACPGLVDEFISGIGLAFSLKDFGISKEEIPALARQSMVLPDYRNNAGVPTYNEMLQIISASF